MAQLIKDWDELALVPANDKFYIELDKDRCCGWIRSKDENSDFRHYLSTHTFYGLTYKQSTVILQECGFDVQIANWDGETEEVNYKEQWLHDGKCEFCRRQEHCSKPCKAKKEREKRNADVWFWKSNIAKENSFDVRKRKELAYITVGQLIEKLSELPSDCKVNFSGSQIGYLHVSNDEHLCSLDYDDLDSDYYECEKDK